MVVVAPLFFARGGCRIGPTQHRWAVGIAQQQIGLSILYPTPPVSLALFAPLTISALLFCLNYKSRDYKEMYNFPWIVVWHCLTNFGLLVPMK